MNCRFLTFLSSFSLLVFIAIGIFACKPKQAALNEVLLSQEDKIVFLDSVQAAEAIVLDRTDGFFQDVRIAEMGIQMKKDFEESNREVILEKYKQFLKEDVEDFTNEERVFVTETFKKAYEMCQKLGDDVFPKQIRLIKTKAKHYGEQVYYTREDIIVIPYDVLQNRREKAFLGVMLHEIFHIYSRYQPEKREQLYNLIGFYKLESRMEIGEPLNSRILLNPDGIDFRWYINIKTEGDKTVKAVPIISANEPTYTPQKPNFFGYLNFELYPLEENPGNFVRVLSTSEGKSPQALIGPDFFRQIRDNTQYIIHPDEVLADNFMFLAQIESGNAKMSNYSKGGQELLQEMKRILAE